MAGNIKTKLEGSDGFDSDSFDDVVLYILYWLWYIKIDSLTLPNIGYRSDDISLA